MSLPFPGQMGQPCSPGSASEVAIGGWVRTFWDFPGFSNIFKLKTHFDCLFSNKFKQIYILS